MIGLVLLAISSQTDTQPAWVPDFSSSTGLQLANVRDDTDRYKECRVFYQSEDGKKVNLHIKGGYSENPSQGLMTISAAMIAPEKGAPSMQPLAEFSRYAWKDERNLKQLRLYAGNSYGNAHLVLHCPPGTEGAELEEFAEIAVRWSLGHYEAEVWGGDVTWRDHDRGKIRAFQHEGTGTVYWNLRDYSSNVGASYTTLKEGTRAQVKRDGKASVVAAAGTDAVVQGKTVDAGGPILMKGGDIYVSSELISNF